MSMIPIPILIPFEESERDRWWDSLTTDEKKRILREEDELEHQAWHDDWNGTRYMKFLDSSEYRKAEFWFWARTFVRGSVAVMSVVLYAILMVGMVYLAVVKCPSPRIGDPWFVPKLAGLLFGGLAVLTVPALTLFWCLCHFIEWMWGKIRF